MPLNKNRSETQNGFFVLYFSQKRTQIFKEFVSVFHMAHMSSGKCNKHDRSIFDLVFIVIIIEYRIFFAQDKHHREGSKMQDYLSVFANFHTFERSYNALNRHF